MLLVKALYPDWNPPPICLELSHPKCIWKGRSLKYYQATGFEGLECVALGETLSWIRFVGLIEWIGWIWRIAEFISLDKADSTMKT